MKDMMIGRLGRPSSALREFIDSEASGGIMLMVAAAIALIVANSPLAEGYFRILHFETGPVLNPKLGAMTVHMWINDALMAVFFLLVGLEVKREFLGGRLSSWHDRRLPVVAALSGIVVPAMVYGAVTLGQPGLLRGWAIPAATDIAFAIAVLALLGKRAPLSLKLFLATVAIVDDVGAVMIIAVGYTEQINGFALVATLAIMAGMIALGRFGVTRMRWYVVGFSVLWYLVLLSGVHATIAGVLAALVIPLRPSPAAPGFSDSTLHRMEHLLDRPVAWFIVPLFGFANAGVALGGASLFDPLPLAIASGLFFGKQIGIFASVWLTVRMGLAVRPSGASWTQVYGTALLCGIGFTMSLFIGDLAFDDPAVNDAVKIGVLGGSLLSALAGYVVLRFAGGSPKR